MNFILFDLRACALNLLSVEKDFQLAYILCPNLEAAIQYFSYQLESLISQRNIGLIQISYSLLMFDKYLPFA